MATNTKPNTNTKPTKAPVPVPVALPVPAASATSNAANGTGAVVPAAPAAAAARTSAAQRTMWHANTGSTMPPPNLVLVATSTPPKAGNGTRAQHQQALVYVLAQHPNGQATVAQCQAYAKAHAATLQAKFGPCAAQCAANGNISCTYSRGVVHGVGFA